MKSKAFTLIELLIVMAISGLIIKAIASTFEILRQSSEDTQIRTEAQDTLNQWTRYIKKRVSKINVGALTENCTSTSKNCLHIKDKKGVTRFALENICTSQKDQKAKHIWTNFTSQWNAFQKSSWPSCAKKCPNGTRSQIKIVDKLSNKTFALPGSSSKAFSGGFCSKKYGTSGNEEAYVEIFLVLKSGNRFFRTEQEMLLGGQDSSLQVKWLNK